MSNYELHLEYVHQQKAWDFCPMGGICWSCGKDVFEKLHPGSNITGCPHCCRTFCD